MRLLGFGLLLVTMLYSGQSMAAFMTGNALLDSCRDKYTEIFCSGYVAGLADLLMHNQADLGIRLCVPPTVSVEQITDIAIRYLESKPEHRHKVAANSVTNAILAAFPCQ